MAAFLEFGLWVLVAVLAFVGGSGAGPDRRGPDPGGVGLSRPTIHSDMCVVARDDARSEALNAAVLLWHSPGSWLRGASSSSTPAVASVTPAAAGFDGQDGGDCKDPGGLVCHFSFSGVFPVILYGELSLWTFWREAMCVLPGPSYE
jgi:hypothetical protein